VLGPSLKAMQRKRFVDWAFGHYLQIAPPEFVGGGSRAREHRGVPVPSL
jgi:hypothetical protein